MRQTYSMTLHSFKWEMLVRITEERNDRNGKDTFTGGPQKQNLFKAYENNGQKTRTHIRALEIHCKGKTHGIIHNKINSARNWKI
jgi:hypothetical protein